MASRRPNLKRKSSDFIYEVSDIDLTADDDCEDTPSKIQKIDSDNSESSNTINNSNLKTETVTDENNQSTESAEDSVRTNTNNEELSCSVDASEKSEKILESVNMDNIEDTSQVIESSNITPLEANHEELTAKNDKAIEIIDSDTETKDDVIIIEETVKVTEVSDNVDARKEDGEIEEVFQVVDEVFATPTKETDDANIINICFKNEEMQKLYESNILKFLETFQEFDISSRNLCINVRRKSDDLNECTDNPSHKTPRKKHKKKKPKKDLFVLDTTPSDNLSVGLQYSSKFTIEEEKPENVKDGSLKRPPPAQTCFNCSGTHALKDCTIPKDFNKINAARQKFVSNRNKSTRYHEEEDQKYAHLKPGEISENLRKALGLRKNELPSYIYGMRVLGYPPGWLEEAKFVHSSLTMFDIDGERVKASKDNKKKGLNPDKIVEYPGFNAPMQKGFYDDYKRYNVHPYSSNLQKEFMLKHFEKFEPESDSESSSMDVDEGPNIDKKKGVVDKLIKSESSSTNSPSLKDLEKKKEELLDQLNSSSSNSEPLVPCSENDNSLNNGLDDKTTDPPSSIAVKSTAFGTPILKSSSPYSRLPNPDNFMVGVSPVIDFENLPNSTGKYEQMTGVLTKVRSTLKSCKS